MCLHTLHVNTLHYMALSWHTFKGPTIMKATNETAWKLQGIQNYWARNKTIPQFGTVGPKALKLCCPEILTISLNSTNSCHFTGMWWSYQYVACFHPQLVRCQHFVAQWVTQDFHPGDQNWHPSQTEHRQSFPALRHVGSVLKLHQKSHKKQLVRLAKHEDMLLCSRKK